MQLPTATILVTIFYWISVNNLQKYSQINLIKHVNKIFTSASICHQTSLYQKMNSNFKVIEEIIPNMSNEQNSVWHAIFNQRFPDSQSIVYVTGYLAYQWQKKHNCIQCFSFMKKTECESPIIKLRTIEGYFLIEPSNDLVNLVTECEHTFKSNFVSIFHGASVVGRLCEEVESIFPTFPTNPCHPKMKIEIITYFMRLRTRQQCKLMTNWFKRNKRKKL